MNRPLTKDQLQKIRSIYLQIFNKRSEPRIEERWYETIVTFLRYEGAEIVNEDITLMEGLVIDRGLEDEYVNALLEITKPTEDLTDNARIVHLMSATVDEKLRALRFVLHP